MREILIVAISMLLTGCESVIPNGNPGDQKEYKVTVDRVVHDFYIEWPLNEPVPSEGQRHQISKIFEILRQAHDVEVLVLPIYNVPLNNKFVHDRVHILRHKLMEMGVGADKIAVARSTVDSTRKKQGVNIVITEFVMHIPRCKNWDYTVGDFDTTKSLPNFGCYGANYLGKMVANPSSIIKARKTEVDTILAIQAVETYSKAEDISALNTDFKGGINSSGTGISSYDLRDAKKNAVQAAPRSADVAAPQGGAS